MCCFKLFHDLFEACGSHKMVNKCAAPNCSVRYPENEGNTNDGGETCTTTKISSFHFPKDKELYDRC